MMLIFLGDKLFWLLTAEVDFERMKARCCMLTVSLIC